jgi:cytochrome c
MSKIRATNVLGVIGVCLVLLPTMLKADEAEEGKKVFRQCAICHSPVAKQNKVGPSLFGVVGRKSAGLADFTRYSANMKQLNLIWDEKNLQTYLENPKKLVPKGSMAFAGLKKEEDRNKVIAYLKTLK